MKKYLFLAVLLLSSLGGVSQMTPQYSYYHSDTFDWNTNTAHFTIVIQGTTNPYKCTYVCGPGGVTCQIPGCANASHYAKVYNKYGSVGGWFTGPYMNPASSMNFSNTIDVPLDPSTGNQVVENNGTAEVICTGMGGPLTWWGFERESAFTGAEWVMALDGPPQNCNTGFIGTYCQFIVENNCTATTTPPDYDADGRIGDWFEPNYFDVGWIVFATCYRPVNAPTGTPWACGYGIGKKATINIPMPPFPCTHNP